MSYQTRQSVMGEHGVQEGAEHAPLWGPHVEDQRGGGVGPTALRGLSCLNDLLTLATENQSTHFITDCK